jgi:hypothetical protein
MQMGSLGMMFWLTKCLGTACWWDEPKCGIGTVDELNHFLSPWLMFKFFIKEIIYV